MEEHSINLLRECDSGCKMAAESLEQIRDMVSDQELWKDITESYEKHQELDAKIKKTLSAMEEEGKEPGKMASAWSWMSTEMRMLAKGGDKEAASIVTDGCNMGIKTICGYKNQYSGASKAVMEIADELTGMEENLRDHMKKFLDRFSRSLPLSYLPAGAPPPPETPNISQIQSLQSSTRWTGSQKMIFPPASMFFERKSSPMSPLSSAPHFP